jgi:hypothetical protein
MMQDIIRPVDYGLSDAPDGDDADDAGRQQQDRHDDTTRWCDG